MYFSSILLVLFFQIIVTEDFELTCLCLETVLETIGGGMHIYFSSLLWMNIEHLSICCVA